MYASRPGQSQVLTAVLLGGLIVAGISAAFIWGLPLLQKNQDVSSVRSSVGDMKGLSDGIEAVAQEGGSRTVPVDLQSGVLRIDTTDDVIFYQTQTRAAYVSAQDWVPLNENDLQGINATTGEPDDGYGVRGVDRPGVLIGRSMPVSNGFNSMYRIVFRNLQDANAQQTYRIDLVQNGNLQLSGGGKHDVIFQRGDTVVEPGAGVNGGPLRKTQILIRVS